MGPAHPTTIVRYPNMRPPRVRWNVRSVTLPSGIMPTLWVMMPWASITRLSVMTMRSIHHRIVSTVNRSTPTSARYQARLSIRTLSGSSRSPITSASRKSDVDVTWFIITAQCCRTRITLRSVGSRYSSISRGASIGLGELGDEADDGLRAVPERGADARDGTGRVVRLSEDEEEEQRDREQPDDLLDVHHNHRSGLDGDLHLICTAPIVSRVSGARARMVVVDDIG